jgi:hypothetical protein
MRASKWRLKTKSPQRYFMTLATKVITQSRNRAD